MITIKNRWNGDVIKKIDAADLRGVKNTPIVINGLRWVVQISGTGWMQIGCQKHSVSEWSSLDDERIAEMESDALPFWQANKIMLLALCEQWIHPAEDEVQS